MTDSMGVKRQQGSGGQKDLFDEALKASLRHGVSGEGGTGAGTHEERQAHTAWAEDRALTQHLMEEVTSSTNLNQAYKRVKANDGAAGIDGMTVAALRPWIGADMMNIGIQPRHIKIGLALNEQNWDYLTYEVNELKGAFTRVVRTIPRINNRYDSAELIQTMIASPIDELAEGVKAKDAAKSAAAYAAVTTGCNACHQAVAHKMIVIKSPQAEFLPDQEFHPQ